MQIPNLDYIRKLSEGDPEFERNLVTVLKKELPEERTEYRLRLQNCDLREASSLVHKMTHKIGILGMEQAYQLAQVHEELLRNGEKDKVQDFDYVLDQITNFLATL